MSRSLQGFRHRVHLTLYIPGLFGPKGRFSIEYLPAVPALDRFLSRGRVTRINEPSFHFTLARLFECAPPPGRDVPVAAVTRRLDSAGTGDGIWMRADPVHLRADRRSMVLLDAETVGVDTRDALALAAEVQPVLEAGGHELEVPCAQRWYLRLQRVPEMRTAELNDVAGRDIAGAMPAGADAAAWMRLLNEVQIVLHQSRVNEERANRGLAPINSLWFWGCGPALIPDAGRWTGIHGTDLFLRGLAELGGRSCLPVPAGAGECLAGAGRNQRVLVMHDGCRRAAEYQDVETWSAAVAALEREWFQPLEQALRAGRLRSLSLLGGGLQIDIRPWQLLRFWRHRPLLAQLAPGVVGA